MKLTGRRRVFGVMGMLGVAAACIAVQSGVCRIGWPAQPERAAAVAAANDGSLLTLPFELASNKIYMQTTVNGKGPFPFVLDTGAPYTVLDWDLAEGLGISVFRTGDVGGAGHGTVKLGTANGVRLGVGGLRYRPGRMEVIPLNQTLALAE